MCDSAFGFLTKIKVIRRIPEGNNGVKAYCVHWLGLFAFLPRMHRTRPPLPVADSSAVIHCEPASVNIPGKDGGDSFFFLLSVIPGADFQVYTFQSQEENTVLRCCVPVHGPVPRGFKCEILLLMK